MRVIERGHIYALENRTAGEQLLTFQKTLPEGDPSNHDGVLCQEVLRVLIDRVLDLNSQVPCSESIAIVQHLRDAMILFESRAARRALEKAYALTGKHVEQLPVSKKNGHVYDLRGMG